MADEVIISERSNPSSIENNQLIPIQGSRLGTQVLDVGVQSAEFGTGTEYINITTKVAIFYKIGTDPSAADNTDNNEYLPAGASIQEPVRAGEKIDTATAT